jgi:acyl-CoA synthetase (NDP forming)
MVLGITIDAIDYLEAQILARVLDTPVSDVRDSPPYGVKYVVDIQVPGIGAKADRVATVRTAWIISARGDQPRLVTAYLNP